MVGLAHATLTYVSDLRAAGMPEKQAQIQAEFITDIIESNLATKTDIENVKLEIEKVRLEAHTIKAELKVDIEKLRMESKSDREKIKDELLLKIAETKNEMIRWYLGSVVALSAILISFFKFAH